MIISRKVIFCSYYMILLFENVCSSDDVVVKGINLKQKVYRKSRDGIV